jgi:hypothetical protein
MRALVFSTLGAMLLVGGAAAPAKTGSLAPCGPHRWVRDAPRPPDRLQAFFAEQSYAAGQTATLHVVRAPHGTRMRIFHSGPEKHASRRHDVMSGVPVGPRMRVVPGALSVPIGNWQSGLYFARLAWRGTASYAPFVVRAAVPAAHGVAVVLPTYTWQAYNFLDLDHNGYGDTWYADPRVAVVELNRPFLDHGIPKGLGNVEYWMSLYGKRAAFLSDQDLESVSSAATLLRSYKLIVFAGHEEYVTGHVFDLITRYRDLGGNLAFLSANNFYAHVRREGASIRCLGHFRDEDRPEAALVGVGYLDWNHGVFPNKPYVVVATRDAPWFFRGTGLRDGGRFGFSYGVEIDARTAASPRNTVVLAELPDVFGPGRTAEMTYYVAPSGAKVFAAGAMNFGSSQSGVTDRLLLNLWAHLSR